MKRMLLASFLLSATASAAPPQRPAPPPVRPVVEDYFGTRITDNYRYMETSGDPVFGQWIRAEGRYARGFFDSFPGRAALAQRIVASTAAFGLVRDYSSFAGRSFWMERAPGSDNYDLMVRDGTGTRKLIDVAAIRAAKGGTPVAINYFSASPDGSKVAVGLSEGGSERASVSVYDSASGRQLAGPLDRVQFGPAYWSDDGAMLYGNQLADQPPGAPPANRYLNSTAFAWDMKNPPVALFGGGAPASVIKPAPEHFGIVQTIAGAPILQALVVNGVQNEIELWAAPASTSATGATAWRRLFTRDDDITYYDIKGDTLYLLSHKNAPTFQVLAMKAGEPFSAAKVIVPADPNRLIERIRVAADGLYVVAREGLYSRLFRVSDAGTLEPIALPSKGSIDAVGLFADPRVPGVTFLFDSWTLAPSFYRYDPASARLVDLKLGTLPANYRADAFVASDLRATAKDGTKVPFSVIRPAGATGPGPLLIQAYGSYGVSDFPYFSPRIASVLNEGISFADCHVRGGGELGEAWRLGGKDANKPNTWRDLIACAEEAIAQGLTTKEQLFVTGGSAGGIPMGKAPTERPDLFAGVIDQVPMASALRAEFQTNGPANIPEFGTIKNEQGFRNLLAMDGYQAVEEGKKYPPYLITTGLNDPRVDSWQPGKLAARMRAANPKNVVLLRVDEEAGHGIGSTKTQTDQLYADMIAFINWRLGKPGWTPAE